MCMSEYVDRPNGLALSGEGLGGLELECRECGVICERVVSPWRCLRGNRSCVYAFTDGESTYFGCLHKVFLPEFDIGAFGVDAGGGTARSDPYGAVRVNRVPRSQCPVSVERAYNLGPESRRCANPVFLEKAFRAHIDDRRVNRNAPAVDESAGF